MQCTERCTERETCNGCVGAEWLLMYWLFTSMISWLLQTWDSSSCQHCERSSCMLPLVQEKVKIKNLTYDFYRICIAFAPS